MSIRIILYFVNKWGNILLYKTIKSHANNLITYLSTRTYAGVLGYVLKGRYRVKYYHTFNNIYHYIYSR